MTQTVKSPRKLIEVALPLDVINAASSKEKSIRQAHPSTVHLWWARRPLATARAVLFAQLVNDPGYQQGRGFKYGKNKKEAAVERKRLFKIMEDLVRWENTNRPEVFERARVEIHRSWREVCDLNKDHPQAAEIFNPDKLPYIHDPFAGGGTIPLEAQRLGLSVYASDLNPVPVLMNKALVEIPAKFANLSPVSPEHSYPVKRQLALKTSWQGSAGLAEDVRRYGSLIYADAWKRLQNFYPKIEITPEIVNDRIDLKSLLGQKLPVIAWMWARTVKSPNPAFSHVHVPLTSTFVLHSKEGREAYVHPIIDADRYQFQVKTGAPPASAKNGTKLSRGANFRCLLSDTPIEGDYIKAEGRAGRMGLKMLGIVVDGPYGRIYLSPNEQMEKIANSAAPAWKPEIKLPDDQRNFWTTNYGLTTFGDLFTSRQLLALTTFADLITEIWEKICADAIAAGLPDDNQRLEAGGRGAQAYSDAVSVYLGLTLSKLTSYHCTQGIWRVPEGKSGRAFGRQSIPMVWDFPECNPFANAGGEWLGAIEDCAKVIQSLPCQTLGQALQLSAQSISSTSFSNTIFCTDPPYYDNVAYADLSDFFYVWLRRSLRPILPSLLSTIAVPKTEELVATPYRHGGATEAERFFLDGMTTAMKSLASKASLHTPTTIFYAFKQSDVSDRGVTSTGWETFLEAVIRAGFAITGTWPMRTEQSAALKTHVNSLASSIVLVCRRRGTESPVISRRDFIRELNTLLPDALDEMTKGSDDERSPVAPVDLSQAIIGPGMAVFSKYAAVLEADGEPMTVKTALQLINRFLAEDDFDSDTQFCLHWFEQHEWDEGPFGTADTLARAKGTSVQGVQIAGVVEARGGKVRLKKWSEYPNDWNPETDTRNPIWETMHQFIRALKHDGETAAGRLLAIAKGQSESVRQLAYRLYTLCERQGWAEDARAYNELITSWTAIESAASESPHQKQLSVFD